MYLFYLATINDLQMIFKPLEHNELQFHHAYC